MEVFSWLVGIVGFIIVLAFIARGRSPAAADIARDTSTAFESMFTFAIVLGIIALVLWAFAGCLPK